MVQVVCARVFRLGLRLYPRAFRETFADEMAAVFAKQVEAETQRGGLALLGLCVAELSALAGQGAREHLYALRARPGRVAQASTGQRLFAGSRWPAVLGRVLLILLALALLGALVLFFLIPLGYARLEATPRVNQVALADLNGDGHLDAFLAIGRGGVPYPAYVLYNDGTGRLGATAQALGKWHGYSVAVGDVRTDGYPDAVLDITAGGLLLYLNEGERFRQREYGYLAQASPGPRGVMSLTPVVGDLNGDGRLDVFAAGCCGRPPGEHVDDDLQAPVQLPYSQAWLQTPDGLLAPGPALGHAPSKAAALADLNGDGSLDVYLANGRALGPGWQLESPAPDTVWFNDGQGNFGDSGQALSTAEGTAAALGDVNGDGFADAVVGTNGPDEVWLNDGRGFFSDSGQRLGSGLTEHVFLADLDGDGDLDVVAAGATRARAWLNDGRGQFQLGGLRLRYSDNDALGAGDLDGDSDVDLVIAGPDSSRVWHNDGQGRFTAGPRVPYR
jgi:hypothetical protein